MNAVCKTMARSTVLLLFLFIICPIDFSLGRPSGKLRIKVSGSVCLNNGCSSEKDV